MAINQKIADWWRRLYGRPLAASCSHTYNGSATSAPSLMIVTFSSMWLSSIFCSPDPFHDEEDEEWAVNELQLSAPKP